MNVSESTTKLLSKAKISLMTRPNSAFFSVLLMSLKFKWDDSVNTAYTDGLCIGMNPDFFLSMNQEERIGVLLHEAMHVAYMHISRTGSKNRSIFNNAADNVINLQLLERGFSLPSFALKEKRFKEMDTEAVYAILFKEYQDNPDKQQPNSMPDLLEGTGIDEEGNPIEGHSAGIEQEIKEILSRAMTQSKLSNDKPGSIPGDISIAMDALLNPKLPWQSILRKYLTAFNKTLYSWKKPNRRFFPEIHLPSLHGESLGDIAIAVDISGSVSDSDFKFFINEIASIIKRLKPASLTLIQFDTQITSVDKIKTVNKLLSTEFIGRGGTCISPVIKWAKKHKPALLIYFTDGYFNPPKEDYKGNTIWMIHNNPTWQSPGYGKVIHYDIK